MPRDVLGASTLIANVFDGGERTTVTMRIGERAPLPMRRQARPDPFVEEVFARNEATEEALGQGRTAHECCSSVDRPFAETERADGHIRLTRLLRIDDEHFEERHGFPGCDYCAAMARKGILSSVNNAFLTGCYPALFKLSEVDQRPQHDGLIDVRHLHRGGDEVAEAGEGG